METETLSETGGGGGIQEDGDPTKRRKKKYKKVSGEQASDNSREFAKEEAESFRDKLLGTQHAVSSDKKGSRVFDDAWNEYLASLKRYFINGVAEQDQDQMEDEDCPILRVPREEYERWCAPWRKSLIVKLLGKCIPLWLMKQNLERLWKTKHAYTIRDLDNDFFVVSFDDEYDMNQIHQEGPWMIVDHYLIVQHWRPNFDPWEAELQKKKLQTLKVDKITYASERGRFARICVELDLRKKLKLAINVFGKRRILEYEGLHLICFHYCKYGHHRDNCLDNAQIPISKETVAPKQANIDGSGNIAKVNVDLNLEPNDPLAHQAPCHNVSESGIPKRPNEDKVAEDFFGKHPAPSTEGLRV
ncbi:uncharacterized protein LOC114755608 [Neltuma alba]|uniref:uncharacterized protein LOC114755608 n=1 Tax=Neltuma alba TaxID=207710 RepID=UPI0010A4AF45|nr:uncharacterized protein LOC114755608 [Prosopis alba]